jgi:integrase
MKRFRRAPVIVALSLLTSAATAHAECAWVLWVNEWFDASLDRAPSDVHAFPTRSDCLAGMEQTAQTFKGIMDSETYIVRRQEETAASATIRRELSTLTKMLRLAFENGKLVRLPILHKPKEGPPREGFFEPGQYDAVRRRLSADLQAAIAIAYTCGWRMQSEVLTLERRQLDLEAGTLRLEPGTTKNDEGRVVYLTPELKSARRLAGTFQGTSGGVTMGERPATR